MLQNSIANKSSWENSTLILKRIISKTSNFSDETIILGLLEWFQDMTWPGINNVIETLKNVNKEKLTKCIEYTIKKAIYEEDDIWLYGLYMNRDNLNIDINGNLYNEFIEFIEFIESKDYL